MTESTAETSKQVPPPEKRQLPVEVFQQFDRWDEAQTVAAEEMKSELLQDFVYSIEVQGKLVTSLSAAGINEAMRRRGGVEIRDIRTEVDDKEIHAIVHVKDLIKNLEVTGTASCEKTKPFAWTLAVNKAERNAFRKLIPQKLIANLIKEYLERRKPKTVGAGVAETEVQRTPALPESPVPAPASRSPASQEEKPAEITVGKATAPNNSGTSTAPSIPKETKPSPEKATPWKVSVTANQPTPDLIAKGHRWFPLFRGTVSFGAVNQFEDEVSVVPERPIPTDTALVDGFLLRKIIEPLVAKHGLAYTLKRTSNGLLEAVLIRGKLPDQQLKELISGARWAFEKSLENGKNPK